MGVRRPLLGGQKGQQRREGIDGEALSRRKRQVLAPKLEVVSRTVIADHLSIGPDYLHPEVVQFKGIPFGLARIVQVSTSRVYALALFGTAGETPAMFSAATPIRPTAPGPHPGRATVWPAHSTGGTTRSTVILTLIGGHTTITTNRPWLPCRARNVSLREVGTATLDVASQRPDARFFTCFVPYQTKHPTTRVIYLECPRAHQLVPASSPAPARNMGCRTMGAPNCRRGLFRMGIQVENADVIPINGPGRDSCSRRRSLDERCK